MSNSQGLVRFGFFTAACMALAISACSGGPAPGDGGTTNNGGDGGTTTDASPGPSPTKGAYGSTGCSKGDDCEGGHCLVTSSGGVCSKGCKANSDCENASGYSWYCEVTGSVCKPDKKL